MHTQYNFLIKNFHFKQVQKKVDFAQWRQPKINQAFLTNKFNKEMLNFVGVVMYINRSSDHSKNMLYNTYDH